MKNLIRGFARYCTDLVLVISWMHWAAESARWSNWPGRASTAKMLCTPAGRGKSSSSTVSTWGSANTVPLACS